MINAVFPLFAFENQYFFTEKLITQCNMIYISRYIQPLMSSA